MVNPKDRENKKSHIKQALHWNGYLSGLVEGEDTLPLDQPAADGEENLDPALDQEGQALPQRTPWLRHLSWSNQRRDTQL